MLSPLLLNIVFAPVIIVVVQRFVEQQLIVSDLVYLDDAPKSKDGRPREEGTMIDIMLVAYQGFGLTVSEKKIEDMHLWSDPSTASNALRIGALGVLQRERRNRHQE